MKSIEDLKRESTEALRVAREHRERREFKRPILEVFDRMSRGDAAPDEVDGAIRQLAGDVRGPTHPPRLAILSHDDQRSADGEG